MAAFLGDTNLVEGRVTAISETGGVEVESALGTLRSSPGDAGFRPRMGEEVWISIRPECWRLGQAASTDNAVSGRLEETSYLGEIAEHRIRTSSVALRFSS